MRPFPTKSACLPRTLGMVTGAWAKRIRTAWWITAKANTLSAQFKLVDLQARHRGHFHKVSDKYLALYVAEFQFRYNNLMNADIFETVIKGR